MVRFVYAFHGTKMQYRCSDSRFPDKGTDCKNVNRMNDTAYIPQSNSESVLFVKGGCAKVSEPLYFNVWDGFHCCVNNSVWKTTPAARILSTVRTKG